jgi:hypothetical protein
MKAFESRGSAHSAGRRITGRAQQDQLLDPYLSRHKPPEPASCPRCGAHFDDDGYFARVDWHAPI